MAGKEGLSCLQPAAPDWETFFTPSVTCSIICVFLLFLHWVVWESFVWHRKGNHLSAFEKQVFNKGRLQMPGKWEKASWQLYSMNKLTGWRSSSEYRWIPVLNRSSREIFKPLQSGEKYFLALLISCLCLCHSASHTLPNWPRSEGYPTCYNVPLLLFFMFV